VVAEGSCEITLSLGSWPSGAALISALMLSFHAMPFLPKTDSLLLGTRYLTNRPSHCLLGPSHTHSLWIIYASAKVNCSLRDGCLAFAW
jgi:hypothetical protein